MSNYKPIKLNFNVDIEYDAIIYEFLKSQSNTSRYVKEAVLEKAKNDGVINKEIIEAINKNRLNNNTFTTGPLYSKELSEIENIDKVIILKHQNGKCKNCGKTITIHNSKLDSHWHIDHIYPKSLGGLTAGFNVQILCATCNTSKGNNLKNVSKDHIKLCEENNLLWNRIFYKNDYSIDEIRKTKEHIFNYLKTIKLDFESIYCKI